MHLSRRYANELLGISLEEGVVESWTILVQNIGLEAMVVRSLVTINEFSHHIIADTELNREW